MSNAIFVIGATSNAGAPLTQQLAERGETVRAATRHPADYDGPQENVEAVRFDMADPSTHKAALGAAERIFMMAPPDMSAYPQLVPFIDTAQRAGAQHVVLMTAMGLDQAPDDVPMRQAELHLQESGLDYTILRPNWFMQNFVNRWSDMIEETGVIRLPAGDAETSFIDARDIAAVAAAALTEDGRAGNEYTLTGPEALTHYEVADLLSQASGRTIRYEPVSDEEALRIMTEIGGLNEDYAEMLVGLFQSVRAGHTAPVTSDVEEATGQAPRPLEQYARENAEAWT